MTAARVEARPIWITSCHADADHAVWDDVLGERIASGRAPWYFPAVCGAHVVPAALATPPAPRCAECVAMLRARATLRDLPERRDKHPHRRPGLFTRLLRRRSRTQTQAGAGSFATTAPVPAGHHHAQGRVS
jgi:hypothetical protein